MSSRNVIGFLQALAAQADLLEYLKVKSKDEVITTAAQLGYPFTEPEFDSLIWNLEICLAEKRGEKFDIRFFSTMWGKYYLEYLVGDLIPSFTAADFDAVMTGGAQGP
jgi:Nif11 domain